MSITRLPSVRQSGRSVVLLLLRHAQRRGVATAALLLRSFLHTLREPRFAVTNKSFLISHGSLDLLLRSLHVVFLDDLSFFAK
jgi:hypothetical protein